MTQANIAAALPVLPVKHSVLFPGGLVPLTIGRSRSLAAVEHALGTEEKVLLVVAQRNPDVDEPALDQLYTVGTRAVIKQVERSPKGHINVLVLGLERVTLLAAEQQQPFLAARAQSLPALTGTGAEVEALHQVILGLIAEFTKVLRAPGVEQIAATLAAEPDPVALAYGIASLLTLDTKDEQAILEAATRVDLLRRVHATMSHQLEVLKLRHKITSEAQAEMGKSQREYLLRQQLKAIQQELGEDDEAGDIPHLKRRIEESVLPEPVRKEAEREIGRLARTPVASAEHQVIRSYLELVLELPWEKASADNLDLPHVRQVLDEDHYGIKEVKERIVEHLAVLKLNPAAKAPILCLVGPPGVGKTSLGQSIARALGRAFERFSLGGVHDEAELRGHRRTYVGAMPGRIIQAMRRAGVNNPVLMLDEVDKIGRDFRGDPAAALLEVLDPAQNHAFRDHYVDLPFDLSRVMFITTANTLDTVSQPLLDRMEVIRLPGYSEAEKGEIARRYLWPRRLAEAGLRAEQVTLAPDALDTIVERYTREAGVRQLEQMLGRVTRKVALTFAEGTASPREPIAVTAEVLADWLGPERFMPEEARKQPPAGVAMGLAWTPTGGDVLYVETSLLPGGTDLTLTGQLGDVMQESARAARSHLWAHAVAVGIDPARFKRTGVHIHVPSGAIPKDGPSAGVTMSAALASAYLERPVRNDTAMTGEISLSGLVLPVGGIKEKVLAARRAGIRRIILPKANEKDLREVPAEVRDEMSFVLVETIEDVLSEALTPDAGKPPLASAA